MGRGVKTSDGFCLQEHLQGTCSGFFFHLFHADPVSTLGLQDVVHHDEVLTGDFPLLAGKVHDGKEAPVVPGRDQPVHLLHHLCWQTGPASGQHTQGAGKGWENSPSHPAPPPALLSPGNLQARINSSVASQMCEPPFLKINDLFVF